MHHIIEVYHGTTAVFIAMLHVDVIIFVRAVYYVSWVAHITPLSPIGDSIL